MNGVTLNKMGEYIYNKGITEHNLLMKITLLMIIKRNPNKLESNYSRETWVSEVSSDQQHKKWENPVSWTTL